MENFLGLSFFLIIFLIILISTKEKTKVRNFLIIAFLLRSALVIFDHFNFIIIPESRDSDAYIFEINARQFSKNFGLLVIFNIFEFSSQFLSKIISIFYTIFGESKLMARSLSVALGTVSVYLVYYICLKLWDYRSAEKAAWITTFFPTLILYSSLTLREPYVVFFLLTIIISMIKLFQKNSFISFFYLVFGSYILMLLHGPLIFGSLIILSFFFLRSFTEQLVKTLELKMLKSFIIITIPSLLILIIFFNSNFQIPYVGKSQELLNFDQFSQKINIYFRGSLSYPSWLIISDIKELFFKGIIKIFYFLFGPFIWNINESKHIFGLFDGMLYILFIFYLIKNWYFIWRNQVTRILLIILASYVIIYGIGAGNFGTTIRHRSKFIVMLIILGAPMINKFVFSFNKKIYKR